MKKINFPGLESPPSLTVPCVVVVNGSVGDSWSITCHRITCVYMTQQRRHPNPAFTRRLKRKTKPLLNNVPIQ